MFNLDKPLKFLWILLLYIPIVYAEPARAHLIQASRITNQFIKQVEEKYDISCYATGGSMVHDIKQLSISFEVNHRASIEQARDLEINLIKMLIELVNKDEEVRPYLDSWPCSKKGVSITLIFTDNNGDYFMDGSVASVHSGQNQVLYCRYDKSTERLVGMMEESYEEAELLAQEAETIQVMDTFTDEDIAKTMLKEKASFWYSIRERFYKLRNR